MGKYSTGAFNNFDFEIRFFVTYTNCFVLNIPKLDNPCFPFCFFVMLLKQLASLIYLRMD